MKIEQFFLKSVGEWNSMRSGHSLAFQEFDEIRSKIKIIPANTDDSRVIKLFKDNAIATNKEKKAFLISWETKSEWGDENEKENSSGESILIPLETSEKEGKLIRSVGYTEAIAIMSLYKTLSMMAHEFPLGSATTYEMVFVAVSKNDVTFGFI